MLGELAPQHTASGKLTGVELHRIGGMIRVGIMSVTFPIIIGHKHSVQNDGDNLQNQGQDGELQPHVGGIRRHPGSSYLSAALSVCPSLCHFFFVERLCYVKGGKRAAPGFKVLRVLWWPMREQKIGAWTPSSCTLLTRDGFPLWTEEGVKQD